MVKKIKYLLQYHPSHIIYLKFTNYGSRLRINLKVLWFNLQNN